MKLENRFTVPVPVDQAWQVLLDVQRIVPCMPGATLTSIDGDRFEGTVKVKVGPINLTYAGKASFVAKDEATHVAVIDGSGTQTRGTGTAKALITCRLVGEGDTTQVEVDTELTVTGKLGQFGRGVLADVSGKLVDQFAACLSQELRTGAGPEPVFAATAAALGTPEGLEPVAAPVAASVAEPVARRPSPEAIDLLDTAGVPVLKRLLPALAGLAVLALIVRRRRRR